MNKVKAISYCIDAPVCFPAGQLFRLQLLDKLDRKQARQAATSKPGHMAIKPSRHTTTTRKQSAVVIINDVLLSSIGRWLRTKMLHTLGFQRALPMALIPEGVCRMCVAIPEKEDLTAFDLAEADALVETSSVHPLNFDLMLLHPKRLNSS